MGIFDKFRYWRVAMVLMPSGLLLLILGIKGIVQKPDLSELEAYRGKVVSFGLKDLNDDGIKYEKAFYVAIQSEQKGVVNEFFTPVTTKKELLQAQLNSSEVITIWVNAGGKMIKQAAINDVVIVPLSKSIAWALILVIAGAILFVISLIYALTQRDDLS